jgi:hypothetical protein
VLGRGLLNEFPNPERTGCPGPDVLKRIASHDMPLSEAEKWLDHLTSCSPCYRDFSQLRVAQEKRRARTLLALAAGVSIVACLVGWGLRVRQKQPRIAQTTLLDLRSRSIARGTEPNSAEPPLEVSRKAKQWTVYLPLGSSAGAYELRLVRSSGDKLLETTSTAKLNDGVTSLEATVNVSFASPGKYLLEVRKAGAAWNSYQIIVK